MVLGRCCFGVLWGLFGSAWKNLGEINSLEKFLRLQALIDGIFWWRMRRKFCVCTRAKQETQCDVRVWSVEEKRDDANCFFFFGFTVCFSVYVSLPPELLFRYTEAAECLENKYVALVCHVTRTSPLLQRDPENGGHVFGPEKEYCVHAIHPNLHILFAERFVETGFERPHGTTSFQPTKWVCTCSFGGTGYWQSSGLPQQSQVRCTIKRESQTWWEFQTRPFSK